MPLGGDITKAQLKSEIREWGVMDDKISLYEFVKVLEARYGGKPEMKKLLEQQPRLFWMLSQEHLDCWHAFLDEQRGQGTLNPRFEEAFVRFGRKLANTKATLFFRTENLLETDFARILDCLNRLMNRPIEDASLDKAVSLLTQSIAYYQLDGKLHQLNNSAITDKEIMAMTV